MKNLLPLLFILIGLHQVQAESPKLIRHFTFDAGFKESIYQNEPTEIVGAPELAEGISGQALHLDGQSALIYDDYFDLNLEEFTLTAWVNLNQQEGSAAVANKGVDSYWLFVNYGEVKAGFRDTKNHQGYSGIYLQPGQWYFTAVTYDGEMLRLFVNHHLHWLKKIESAPRRVAEPFAIGAEPASKLRQFYKGMIDEVRLYDGALTNQDILKLYQASKPTPQEEASQTKQKSTSTEQSKERETLTIYASGDVYVQVQAKDTKERLYRNSFREGESASLELEGPVSLLFTAGEHVAFEWKGNKLKPSRSGQAMITLN